MKPKTQSHQQHPPFRFATVVILAAFLSALAPGITGCKSYWIEARIQNQSGQTIRELEVDYPTASFGTNSLAPGAEMRYRLQVRGSGPVKVEYTSIDGKTSRGQGLTLVEHQQGQLLIRLLPGGKVEFSPTLQPAS